MAELNKRLAENELVCLKLWDSARLDSLLVQIQRQVNQQVSSALLTTHILRCKNIHLQHEAASRLTIDQWLLALMEICETINKVVILFPEFRLSQSSDYPAKIHYGDYVTFITGTTDYGLLALDTWAFDIRTQGTSTISLYSIIG